MDFVEVRVTLKTGQKMSSRLGFIFGSLSSSLTSLSMSPSQGAAVHPGNGVAMSWSQHWFVWFCAITFIVKYVWEPLTHYSVAVKDNHYPVGRVYVILIENRRHRGVSWLGNRWGPAGPRRFQTKKHRGGFLRKPRSPRTTCVRALPGFCQLSKLILTVLQNESRYFGNTPFIPHYRQQVCTTIPFWQMSYPVTMQRTILEFPVHFWTGVA